MCEYVVTDASRFGSPNPRHLDDGQTPGSQLRDWSHGKRVAGTAGANERLRVGRS
jgi:hypothetical protein